MIESQEIWVPIEGFAGYEVSNKGSVSSFWKNRTRVLSKTRKILKQHLSNGYPKVVLCSNGVHFNRMVHRLVAVAFLGKPPAGLEVNHKNGDRKDSRLENLEYVTRSENTKHAYRMGFQEPRIGDENEQCRIKESYLGLISAMLLEGKTQSHIAAIFGVTQPTISKIVNRKKRIRRAFRF